MMIPFTESGNVEGRQAFRVKGKGGEGRQSFYFQYFALNLPFRHPGRENLGTRMCRLESV